MTNAHLLSPSSDRRAHPAGETLDIQTIADRYGWTAPMARWWMCFAVSSVGSRPDAVIAFIDRTVGGATMIQRR